MPPPGVDLNQRHDILSFDEIEILAEIFVDLGIRKVRITGGEPLVRKGIEQLACRLAAIPGLKRWLFQQTASYWRKRPNR